MFNLSDDNVYLSTILSPKRERGVTKIPRWRFGLRGFFEINAGVGRHIKRLWRAEFCYVMLLAILPGGVMAQATGKKPSEPFRPYSPWDRLIFEEWKERRPALKKSYDQGEIELTYYEGFCRIDGNYLAEKYRYVYATGGKFANGDHIGLLGSIFRVAPSARDGTEFLRLNEKAIPKGLKPPRWDSITLLRTGHTAFSGAPNTQVFLSDLAVVVAAEQEISATLSVKWVYSAKPRTMKDVLHQATVKTGDILLLRDKGHVVRAIVPPNPETRVVGWIELAPEPLAEADLVRDKKKFVRPTPIAEIGK